MGVSVLSIAICGRSRIAFCPMTERKHPAAGSPATGCFSFSTSRFPMAERRDGSGGETGGDGQNAAALLLLLQLIDQLAVSINNQESSSYV